MSLTSLVISEGIRFNKPLTSTWASLSKTPGIPGCGANSLIWISRLVTLGHQCHAVFISVCHNLSDPQLVDLELHAAPPFWRIGIVGDVKQKPHWQHTVDGSEIRNNHLGYIETPINNYLSTGDRRSSSINSMFALPEASAIAAGFGGCVSSIIILWVKLWESFIVILITNRTLWRIAKPVSQINLTARNSIRSSLV